VWLPDVFGYPAALPTIMRGCGIRYFTTHKLNWNQFNRFPHHTCIWRGQDGSEVFAHFQVNGYNVAGTPSELLRYEDAHLDNDRVDHALCLFGMGDGGGGPGPTHLEWLRLAHNVEGLPRVRMARASAFFRDAEASARDLMAWEGELYFEYHRGTYTTEARIKRMNRRIELALREAELVHALGPLAGYPAQRLDALWRRTLTLQFHDILPGSSIRRVNEETHAEHDAIAAEVDALVAEGEAALAERIDARGTRQPLVVRNSLSWDRAALVELPAHWVPDADVGQRIETAAGSAVLLRLEAPALGHAVVDLAALEAPRPGRLSVREDRLENDRVRIELAGDGTLARLYDKEAGREVLTPAGGGNRFCLYEDLPVRFDAWDIDRYYLEQTPTSPALVQRRVLESGPLRAAIEQTLEGEAYRVVQRIELEADARLVAFDTRVDWRASEHMLRVEFPVAIHASSARYEMQFGHVERPTHGNTRWDWARFEGVAHRWADLSQPDYGVTLVNDCKYGHRIEGATISLNLLRAPKFPDLEVDIGTHRLRYGLVPHCGDHRDGEAVRHGYAFNVPLRVIRTRPRAGPLPAWWSLARPGPRNLVVDAVKRAETGDGLVLRLYEAEGADARGTLELCTAAHRVARVNLLEAEHREAVAGAPDGREAPREVPLSLTPFEIRTLKLQLDATQQEDSRP